MTEHRDPVCNLVDTNDRTHCGVYQSLEKQICLEYFSSFISNDIRGPVMEIDELMSQNV